MEKKSGKKPETPANGRRNFLRVPVAPLSAVR